MIFFSRFVLPAVGRLLRFCLGSRVLKYLCIRLIENVVTVGIILGFADHDIMLAPNRIGEEMFATDILRRAANIGIRISQKRMTSREATTWVGNMFKLTAEAASQTRCATRAHRGGQVYVKTLHPPNHRNRPHREEAGLERAAMSPGASNGLHPGTRQTGHNIYPGVLRAVHPSVAVRHP